MAETIKEVGLSQQPKNVQNVGIFEEVGSFDWPKMQLAKKGRKILTGASPPKCPMGKFWDHSIKEQLFSTQHFRTFQLRLAMVMMLMMVKDLKRQFW